MTVYRTLLDIRSGGGKGLFVLLDPDKSDINMLCRRAESAQDAGAIAVLIGGSHISDGDFDSTVREIKKGLDIPLIIFPGGATQLSQYADAVLFLSLISGRNPQYLIGEHISAAPRVKQLGLEVIPTAYMLIESGVMTAIEFVSDTKPIPRRQTGLAAAHALAGEMLGMKLIYLEAGSGGLHSVPPEMVAEVVKSVSVPVIVGGGIKSAGAAEAIAYAGADFIVVGNALEKDGDDRLLRGIAAAIS
ncbi:MAG: geranylgeranylglyceryl/heptaprenylglyceryl phosphate synthase [candidate division Zixibacteria bacterium]|nr:geranylgeranylglyceryl/heptaprenylglyceryl phosphate synthase [Candidatus Tariuqbacter arcticus]